MLFYQWFLDIKPKLNILFLFSFPSCLGICHQTDVPSASHSLECQRAEAGCHQWPQGAPWGLHGHQRGRVSHGAERHQPDPARGHRQAAPHPLLRGTPDRPEDCEYGQSPPPSLGQGVGIKTWYFLRF